jgi:hypothetical protein
MILLKWYNFISKERSHLDIFKNIILLQLNSFIFYYRNK